MCRCHALGVYSFVEWLHINIGCVPWSLSTLFSEAQSLTDRGAHRLARISQPVSPREPALLLQCWCWHVLNYLTQLVMWALAIKDLKYISCELACVRSHFLGLRFPIQKPIIRCKVRDLLLGFFFLNTGKNIKERHQALSWSISKHQTDGISLQTVDQTFYLPRTKLIHCVSFGVDHISWSLVISNFNDCSLNMSDCDECQVQIYMNQP